MIFRAQSLFNLKLKNGEVRTIVHGEIFSLNDADGQRLLTAKPHLVEVLKTVRWRSTIFPGILTGQVLMSDEGPDVLVQHPKVGQPAFISLGWVIQEKGTKPCASPRTKKPGESLLRGIDTGSSCDGMKP